MFHIIRRKELKSKMGYLIWMSEKQVINKEIELEVSLNS